MYLCINKHTSEYTILYYDIIKPIQVIVTKKVIVCFLAYSLKSWPPTTVANYYYQKMLIINIGDNPIPKRNLLRNTVGSLRITRHFFTAY